MTALFESPVVLRAHTGEALDLDLDRWHDRATAEEADLLEAVDGPVIDLGCGPGRLVVRLASQGVPVLGVDSSPSAVALARMRGATVLQRDIFGPLPGEGRWGTALLFDGNVGIGGDPSRLLRRCRQLTGDRGSVVAEVQPPGTGWRRLTAWFERDGRRSQSFDWAVVGADAIAGLARKAGFEVAALAPTPSGRWFARLA
ncbi:MAG TPA: methyltransferase domain-containing protein [Acidimicrobiales bacterium]|nr:methyltransferase domain-containing protein [Acidimicrobiales bacterium]